jgi:hypothetical protein
MSLLNKFRDDKDNLSKKYRDVLDNLSDDDKVKKIYDILTTNARELHDQVVPLIGRKYYILEAIVEYYNLQNNKYLKEVIIKIFGKNPKYAHMCSLLIGQRLTELEWVIEKDEFYLKAYRKSHNLSEPTNE